MRHTLYIRGLRKVEHTVFAVADGQKTYRDPLANGREMAYSSGQQVKRSVLDTFADEIGEDRAPVTFYKVLDKGSLKDREPHSACDPAYPDQLIGGWMRAEKRSADDKGGRPIRRRAPLSISAFRPLSPDLARVDTEKAMTFDRRDSDPARNKVIVRDPKGNPIPGDVLDAFLQDNNQTLRRLNFLAPQKRAYGLYVYDIAIDMRRLFSVSTADEDPELDSDTIEQLRNAGWIEGENVLIAPKAERERIIPALAYAALHWAITSNQSRTFHPMPPLAVALADRADKIAIAIRADLDPEAGVSRPSATVVMDSIDIDSLFVTPVAREIVRGIEADVNAMDRAQAEIERRLRAYDYEAVAV
ncbi:MAG: CRISPR-associated protein Cas7 [Bacteroidota bacterium]